MGTEAPAKTLPIETQESYKIKLLMLHSRLGGESALLSYIQWKMEDDHTYHNMLKGM